MWLLLGFEGAAFIQFLVHGPQLYFVWEIPIFWQEGVPATFNDTAVILAARNYSPCQKRSTSPCNTRGHLRDLKGLGKDFSGVS